MKFAKFSIASLSALPLLAFGATQTLEGVMNKIDTIVSYIVPFLLTLALIYFLWGLVKYIMNAGDEEERKKGRGMMIWGVVALFVMVSVWGLVSSLGSIVGVDSESAPNQDINNLIPTPGA